MAEEMMHYIATFHTHLSALRTARTLQSRGLAPRMMPVPRELSSACGTCIRYESQTSEMDALDEDVEALYIEDEGYQLQHQWE